MNLKYINKSKFIILILLIILSLSAVGCAEKMDNKQSNIQQITHSSLQQVAFEKEMGNVTIISDMGRLQFIVSIEGLEQQEYSINLIDQNDESRVLFSEGNTRINIGNIKNESKYIPESGQIFIWSVHPERLVSNTNELRIKIQSQDKKTIIKSLPFKVPPNSQIK